MNLYLVQHGESMAKELDPERPLSEAGHNAVTRVARFARQISGITVARLHHSGKLRARQTAEILAAHLNLPAPIEIDGLGALDDPLIWIRRLEELTANLMLVGHLPHLARLTGALLCGDATQAPVTFQMGAMVALMREDDLWSLQWMIVPELLQG